MLSKRIEKLRNQSLTATPKISLERARLLTEFYRSGKADKVSIPVGRALAFTYLLEHKEICINDGELIVGERGEVPKATSTYPEICTHTDKDFEILHNREKVWFKSSDKDRKEQIESIAPYWTGKSLRDRIFAELDQSWKDAYEAGVFTEFQEQRAPGHTVLDDKIYQKGLVYFKRDIDISLAQLDFFNDPLALDKREELIAMKITIDALINYAERYADKLKVLAEEEQDSQRKKELEQMESICRKVPANAPETVWEALQYYWFVHIGVVTELNTWDSFNPGRLDQHLNPFYKNDLNVGRFDESFIREILQSFWVKFNNQPAPPKVGVTARESATYTDFCLINLGGVTSSGEDASNEMTYILMDIIEEMRILQPSSMVQISKKNPDRMVRRALDVIKTGFGQPSLFNTDAIIQEMIRQGKSVEDARCGGASGCVETGAFGKESYILTGYFNLPKVLEITLHNGTDPQTGKLIGIKTGESEKLNTFEKLYDAFEKQLNHFIDIKIKGNLIIERMWAKYLPAPFLSVLVDDCISNGTDYNNGGARYNSSYVQGVGMGSLTDSFASLKKHVYDNQSISLAEFIRVLKNNFNESEDFKDELVNNTPKYGNDDDYADDISRMIFESFFNAVDGRPNTKGGHFRINLLPTTCHVYFGSVIGALPDGRLAGKPLSEGISPVQGADRHGPTAVLKSASKLDHVRTGGTLLNQKFIPAIFEDETSVSKIISLIRTYFRMDGHHIQFNVIDADTLRDAQKNPENYTDLIVRVAGYSDYFNDLGVELQNEIIQRTEQSV
ncbi:MAG: glycyl radical protein [Calditrichaeota bacterium]|nr:MAG: glycyl radical protein [Calditrichota bacterium]